MRCLLVGFCLVLASLAQEKSIIDTAAGNDNLKGLADVLSMPAYKPVLDVLNATGPYTVFAPTDAAFTAAGIDPSDVATVTAVLKYHVLNGKVAAADLKATQTVATLEGKSVTITKDDNGVTINGVAKVTTADVMCTNGVVHIIDKVLIPPAASPTTAATPTMAASPTTASPTTVATPTTAVSPTAPAPTLSIGASSATPAASILAILSLHHLFY